MLLPYTYRPDGPLSETTQAALRALGIDNGGSQDDAAEPLDLRTVPQAQWEQYLCFPILPPSDAAAYIAGAEAPLTVLETEKLEDRIAAFNAVTEPWCIVLNDGIARLMRA